MSKPITPEEMKAWIDATWEKCQSEAWREPREWVGLTDEEIMQMLDYGQYGRVPAYARNFVDAIEAKLREKNA